MVGKTGLEQEGGQRDEVGLAASACSSTQWHHHLELNLGRNWAEFGIIGVILDDFQSRVFCAISQQVEFSGQI